MMHKAMVGAMLAAILLGIGDLERGNRLYREGRIAEAVEAYRAALADGDDSARLHYNLGTALLRLERYDEAEQHLSSALSAVEPELRQRTLYNLGGRYLEQARSAELDRQTERRLLDAAVESYKSALRLDPDDMDAKWNLELALQERQQAGGGGAGGDQQEEQQQDGGQQQDQQGGGQPQPQQGPQGRPPRTAPPAGAPLTQEQADQILDAIEQDERELYEDQLRRGSRETPVLRDW